MKVFTGMVVGKKMYKTATVVVERVFQHPVYKKRIAMSKKYQVHDELGASVGQTVRFVPTRPYSKMKRWKVIEIVEDNGKEKKAKRTRKKKGEKSKR
jgi:small subunit ribosomal protein S17